MGRKTRKYKRRSSRYRRSRRYRKRKGGRSRKYKVKRKRRRRSPRRKMSGGIRRIPFGVTATLPTLAAFPPGGPYNPSSTTNGLGHGFYYAKNEKVVDPPANMSARAVGGRKRTRRKKRRKGRRRRGRRSRLRRGGNALVEAIPGGTDLRDAYWAAGNSVRNLWNTWHGQPKNISTSASIQPIGDTTSPRFGPEPDMLHLVNKGSAEAAAYK